MTDNFCGEALFTTVGELRALLEGVPADTPVTISAITGSDVVASLCVLSSIPRGAQLPDRVPMEARSDIVAICICEVSEWSHDAP